MNLNSLYGSIKVSFEKHLIVEPHNLSRFYGKAHEDT